MSNFKENKRVILSVGFNSNKLPMIMLNDVIALLYERGHNELAKEVTIRTADALKRLNNKIKVPAPLDRCAKCGMTHAEHDFSGNTTYIPCQFIPIDNE